jgi:hypothetical protein
MSKLIARAQIATELVRFFWRNKMWWLTPLVIVLFIVGILAIAAQTSAIAPFVYTLF